MQEDPLVVRADAEYLARFFAREALNVAKKHHCTLPRRQLIERRAQRWTYRSRNDPVVSVVNPCRDRLDPLTRGVEKCGVLAATLSAHEPATFRAHGSAGLRDDGGALTLVATAVSPDG
jgi:hypothetical protein